MRNNSTAISGLVVMGVAREEIVGAARTPWGANVRDCRITPFSDKDLPSIAGGRTRRPGEIH